MMDLPRISVIIPTRNRSRYLKRGLDKLLESDYPNLEIIVMDGGSTDDTVQLLKSYANRITKWVSESDGGEYAALNKGIMWSTGDYIMHFTDDDVIIPSSLRSIGEYATGHPEYDILFAQVNLWREIDGAPFQYGVTKYLDPEAIKPRRYFRVSSGPPSQGAFVRRSLYERIGLHATDYVISDYEFWARAISSGAKCALLPDVVADYHYTGENTVLRKTAQIRNDHFRIASAYGTRTDKMWVLLKQIVLGVLTNSCHAIGLHPLRWYLSAKVKKKTGVVK